MAEKYREIGTKSFAHYMGEPIVSSHYPPAHHGLGRTGALFTEGGGPVNSNKLWMTAQSAPCFGMPISGHAFGASVPATESRIATTLVVRDRAMATQGAVKRGTGFAQAYLPGTNAWRPPTC
jgi:hypothetical protein